MCLNALRLRGIAGQQKSNPYKVSNSLLLFSILIKEFRFSFICLVFCVVHFWQTKMSFDFCPCNYESDVLDIIAASTAAIWWHCNNFSNDIKCEYNASTLIAFDREKEKNKQRKHVVNGKCIFVYFRSLSFGALPLFWNGSQLWIQAGKKTKRMHFSTSSSKSIWIAN